MARGSVKPIKRRGKDQKEYTVWRARVPAGEGPDGKRRQLTKVHPTRKAADAWVNEQLARAAGGQNLAPDVLTVADLIDRWLALHAREVTPATARVDRWAAGVIAEDLGRLRIDRATPLAFQAFYDRIGARMTPGSVAVVHRVLRSALDQAVAWELVRRNAARLTRRPGVSRAATSAWTAADAQRFLDATREDFDGPLFALLLSTGLRSGEALALDWTDVDLDAGRLTVARTMTYDAGGQVVVGTRAKTRTSHRRVVLPLRAQLALRRQRERQDERRQVLGPLWRECGCVFDRGDGVRRTANAVRYRLRSINADLKIPHISLHGMRHTAATLLFARRVQPKLVQDLLGHASLSVTMDTYTHVADLDREEVARELDAALGAEPEPKIVPIMERRDTGVTRDGGDGRKTP